jgi:outer membrane protein
MKHALLTLFSMVTLSISGFAQSTDTLRFTLPEAIDYAVKNNPQLKSTQMNEDNNKLKIKEIRSSALPQINASANATDNFLRSTQLLPGELMGQPGTTIPIQFGTRFVSGGSVQLNQVLYSPSLNVGLKAAKESQGYYELQTFKTKEDLIYSMATVYVQMQMVEKHKELLEGNIDRMNRLIQITNSQYKEGIVKKVDVDQLRVNYTNLETQISSVSNNYTQLLNNLKLLMNIDVTQPIVISEAPDSLEIPVSRELDLNANTDLNILDKQIQLQELNTKNIKAGYQPTVSLTANFGRQWQTNEMFKGASNPGFSSGYYGIGVSIPIFDGNKKRSQIAQSTNASKQLELSKNYLTKNVENQFKTATDNLNQNEKVLIAQSQNMKVAEDLYNVAKLSYTEGISALSELINAENGLREAQSQYLTAMLQTNLAELATMKSSGQLSQLIKNASDNNN